jgi:hypothetical protein
MRTHVSDLARELNTTDASINKALAAGVFRITEDDCVSTEIARRCYAAWQESQNADPLVDLEKQRQEAMAARDVARFQILSRERNQLLASRDREANAKLQPPKSVLEQRLAAAKEEYSAFKNRGVVYDADRAHQARDREAFIEQLQIKTRAIRELEAAIQNSK